MGFSKVFTLKPNTSAVVVRSLFDLPDPVLKDGVLSIIPGDNEYIFDNDISSPYPLALPGAGKRATLRALNRAKWIYTGTDSCFRDLDAQGEIEIQDLTWFEAPNGNMWEINNTSGGDPWSFQASNGPKFTNMLAMGSINGGTSSGGWNVHFGSITNFNQGLVFEGTLFFEVNLMFVFGNNAPGCVHFTGQGAATSGSINFITPTLSIGSNETVFDMKPEIQAGIDSLNFRGCQEEGGINGTVFAAGSLTQKSLKVVSAANNIMPDSQRIGSAYIKDNVAITNPVTSGQWYDINFGTGLLAGSNIERFTLVDAATGALRYDGETTFDGTIHVALSAISTGGDRVFNFRFVKDSGSGFAVLPDDMVASVEIGAITGSASLLVAVSMESGDIIKPQVTRVDGTSTITVQQYSVNVD
jgi:hypothetical protein